MERSTAFCVPIRSARCPTPVRQLQHRRLQSSDDASDTDLHTIARHVCIRLQSGPDGLFLKLWLDASDLRQQGRAWKAGAWNGAHRKLLRRGAASQIGWGRVRIDHAFPGVKWGLQHDVELKRPRRARREAPPVTDRDGRPVAFDRTDADTSGSVTRRDADRRRKVRSRLAYPGSRLSPKRRRRQRVSFQRIC